ncbi:MAG: hypothetical protein K2Q09_04320, partial [Phycisphaerales bacterium]|nr:hypothetical protein [Phycisphaerales bacterium]
MHVKMSVRLLACILALGASVRNAQAQFLVAGEPISCQPPDGNACQLNLPPCDTSDPCPIHPQTMMTYATDAWMFEFGRRLETEIEWG